MGNALFIVWRESVEAILVVSILYAWIQARGDGRITTRHLWTGVAGGLALAGGLAAAMLGLQSQLAGDALEAFQATIVIIAAGLITHMVLWMRHHGRHLKGELEAGLAKAAAEAGGASAALLAAIAVGREGAETVLFLYGLGLEQSGGALAPLFLGAGLGFLLALATAWLILHGSRWLPSRVFFRISEVVLLLLAAGLLVAGVERFINLEWLPPLVEPVWDSSALLDEGSLVGGLAGAFAGYRAHPSLMLLMAWLGYWLAVAWLTRSPKTPRRA
jgi:high-affinity iron transporter